jgi:hypothetical protein
MLGQERLIAPNPFDATDIVIGCPKCKTIGEFCLICDEEGCWNGYSIGHPNDTGKYRQVCGEHYREIMQREEEE